MGVIAAALSLAACTDGGGPLTMGQRILDGRDVETTFFWRPRTLAYTRPSPRSTTEGRDLWVRELDETDASIALQDLQWTPTAQWPMVRIGNLLLIGENLALAYDLGTRARDWYTLGPVVMSPDGKALAHWEYASVTDGITAIGPVKNQRGVAGFVVRTAAFVGDDLMALGHRNEDPDGAQVLARLSPADFTVTVVAAGLPAWDTSGADALSGDCLAVSTEMCRFFQVLGCAADTAACPETGEIPCAIVYAYDTPDATEGNLTVAAYDVNRAMDVPIDGHVFSNSRLLRSPDARRVAWDDAGALNVWDACTQRALRCEGGAGLETQILPGDWRPDSGAIRMVSSRQSLLVMSAEDGTCVLPPTVGPTLADYSPDSTRMAWLDQQSSSGLDRALWIADGLGQDAVMVAYGPIVDALFSDDARFVVVRRLHDGAGSIGVIDLTAPSLVERPLASPTSFTMVLGGQRLLTLTRWNSQDQTGQVELFDLVRGTSTVLAAPATTLAVAGSVDDAVDLAYVVRTRVASSFDGLWLATLPAIDAP